MKKNKIGYVFLVFLYLISLLLNNIFASNPHELIIGGVHFPSLLLCDIIKIHYVLVGVLLTLFFYKLGYWTSLLLYLIHIFFILTLIFEGLSNLYIPSIVTILWGFMVSTIIYLFLNHTKQEQETLHHIALTDTLTGLPNRRAFLLHLQELTENKHSNFAVLVSGINDFKAINDTMGHDIGDGVLTKLASRLRLLAKPTDYLARIGGDEFALIITEYDDEEELKTYAESIRDGLKSKIHINSHHFYMSSSIGISLFPEDATDVEHLFQCADTAMFNSKHSASKEISFFRGSMIDMIEKDVAMEHSLRHALENDLFTLVFQAQYYANGQKLRGFETLLRMNTIDGTAVSPSQFIPVAERSGMIIEIERWVLKTALETFKSLIESRNNQLILSINISVVHLMDQSFLLTLLDVLNSTKFPPECLELEITESVFISSKEHALDVLNEIRSLGVRIALDDFGTGYASLNYLTHLPIDLLKIDKSFVDDITTNPKGAAIVSAIIDMGHTMGFEVIAEGVENNDQVVKLKTNNCDLIQGFIWSRPIPYETVESLLRKK